MLEQLSRHMQAKLIASIHRLSGHLLGYLGKSVSSLLGGCLVQGNANLFSTFFSFLGVHTLWFRNVIPQISVAVETMCCSLGVPLPSVSWAGDENWRHKR